MPQMDYEIWPDYGGKTRGDIAFEEKTKRKESSWPLYIGAGVCVVVVVLIINR